MFAELQRSKERKIGVEFYFHPAAERKFPRPRESSCDDTPDRSIVSVTSIATAGCDVPFALGRAARVDGG